MLKVKNLTFKIEKISLKEPYKLSYKTLDYYETVIISIVLSDDTVLNGEVTPLAGYTDETIDDVVNEIIRIKKKILGKEIKPALELLYNEVNAKNSFALSGIIPPLEVHLDNNQKVLDNIVVHKKDLIYALKSEQDAEKLNKEISQLIQDGYSTVKIKVGKSLTEELKLIQSLASLELKDLKIRFDANGGFNFEEAKTFLIALEAISNNVEYLEQPLCRKCWSELENLISLKYKIPIMIDESIYTLEDIKKSYDMGAKFIKIKLCKYGSLYHLQQALDYAKSLDLHVVFGNGVATDISNYYEMFFYLKNKDKIHGATEGVGFLKLKNFEKYNLVKRVINE